MQYEETDLEFCSRLCEHLGISFFFEHQSGKDVIVRILRADVAVSLAGKLRVEAGEIELVAREGEARVVARDDLVLRGETISLN
jgi:uncharacterized protein involved in type VI secretion and phage assembly